MEYQYIFGTGTTLIGTGTSMQSLRNLSIISSSVQGHALLSTTTSRSLMRIVFKPTGGQRKGKLDSRVWFGMVGVFFSYFTRVYRVEYLVFLRILSF